MGSQVTRGSAQGRSSTSGRDSGLYGRFIMPPSNKVWDDSIISDDEYPSECRSLRITRVAVGMTPQALIDWCVGACYNARLTIRGVTVKPPSRPQYGPSAFIKFRLLEEARLGLAQLHHYADAVKDPDEQALHIEPSDQGEGAFGYMGSRGDILRWGPRDPDERDRHNHTTRLLREQHRRHARR